MGFGTSTTTGLAISGALSRPTERGGRTPNLRTQDRKSWRTLWKPSLDEPTTQRTILKMLVGFPHFRIDPSASSLPRAPHS